jgi:GMP synthase (glutamine-hydrolysing)
VFQWHACTYDLPAGAVHLARTQGCEQQAFRFGTNAYGFQFHMEANTAMIERWLRLPAYREELAAAGIGRDAQSIRAATESQIIAMQPLAERTFNNFLDMVGRPARRIVLPSRDGVR